MDNLSYSMVVGVYQSPELAKRAIYSLVEDGLKPEQIHIRSKNANDLGNPTADENTFGLYGNVKADLANFFHGMTDGDSEARVISAYTKALEDGHTIISVDTDNDALTNKVASLMSKSASVTSDHTSTSPTESDISDTGSWSGVKIFKSTKDSLYEGPKGMMH